MKIFIIYFPIMLVTCQVLVNLFSFVNYGAYVKYGLILNTLFGVNMFFAAFMVAFTYWFRFCAVSRYTAWAEVLFGLLYLVIQDDNLYNRLFQVVIGVGAIVLTFRYFIMKFPLCRVALLWTFFTSVLAKGSCSKGIDLWDERVKTFQNHGHA